MLREAPHTGGALHVSSVAGQRATAFLAHAFAIPKCWFLLDLCRAVPIPSPPYRSHLARYVQ